ncbi:MAG TPA: LPP20 family lipoprotein [Tenuifilaceae bacterium]|nr:LPP20 family lipoprotein [Tenuifilaceae bacterium]
MTLKTAAFTTLSLFLCLNIFAQPSFESIRKQKDLYLYGFATGQTLREADNAALTDLISQITVRVESEFVNIKTEKDENLTEFTKGIIRTFSNATLDNAERIVNDLSDGTVEVMRFIKRDDLSKIFADRHRKIIEYATDGYKAELDLRIADALKYYYWAFVLLRTHPDLNRIDADLDGGGKRLLITTLPDRMNRILNGISIEIIDNLYNDTKKERRVSAQVLYSTRMVQNLELRYFTGNDWEGVAARNGIFGMTWYGKHAQEMNQVRVGIEYRFDNQLILDAEVKEVFEKTHTPSLPNTTIFVDFVETPVSPKPNIETSDKAVSRAIAAVLGAIETGNASEVEKISTPRGLRDFNAIISYGKAQPLTSKMELQHVTLGGNTIIRSIPMQFNFQRNRVQFSEMVNIILNAEGLIDGFTFSIGSNAINDILTKSSRFGSDLEKYYLIHFMELYKTAYCTKDIDFVKSVFADNALIIIGNVLKEGKNIDNLYGSLGNRVEYVRLDKKEYVERLERVFRSNEFVNIQFDDNTARRATNNPDDKVYGIQIKQSYYSSSYSDKGYLFLMIDLNDTLNPVIYVRTWQPEKNPDGSIFDETYFKI